MGTKASPDNRILMTDFEQFLDGVTDLMFNRLAEMPPEAIELFISIATDIRNSLYKAHTNTGLKYPPEKLEGLFNVALIQFGISWEKSNREREKRYKDFLAGKKEATQEGGQ